MSKGVIEGFIDWLNSLFGGEQKPEKTKKKRGRPKKKAKKAKKKRGRPRKRGRPKKKR